MKVLVTGASGFVGRAVVRVLLAEGHSVRILARHPSSPGVIGLAQQGVEVQPGDLLNPASLQSAAASCQGVIHLVGIISEVGDNTFDNAHRVATANALQSARDCQVRRFIHMSALGTRPGARSRYHQTKWAAEELVRTSDRDWTIFRPSLIYGPGDGFVNLFARLARFSPVVPIMGSGGGKLQPVAVETVALAFVRALTEAQSIGQTYTLTGPQVFEYRQIIPAILAATKRRRWCLPVPLPLARLLATALETVCPLMGRAAPLNREQLLMLEEDNTGEGAVANQLFRLEHPSFKTAIRQFLT
jgi:NADH dehydrogenase